MTIIIYLPDNYRHDHFDLNIRIREDTKELEAAVATLHAPTEQLAAALDAQKPNP